MTRQQIEELLIEEQTATKVYDFLADNPAFDEYFEKKIKEDQITILEQQNQALDQAKVRLEEKLAELKS